MLVLRRTSRTRFSSSSGRLLRQRKPWGQQPQPHVLIAAALSFSNPGARRLHDSRSSTRAHSLPRLPLSSSSSSSRFSTKAASAAPPEALPLATLLSTLPPPRPSCLAEIQQHLVRQGKGKGKKLVIVDDDPTGTQSVRGFPVLAEWTPEALAREIEDESTPGFFLLSNIRAMAPAEAGAVLRDIRQGLDEALERLGRSTDSITVISRSDSTLRGHFPLDVELLCPTSSAPNGKAGGGRGKVLTLVAPYFEAGGRLTINDVHYMTTTSTSLLPVHLTPFAHDKAFGFKTSNLKDWVEQKLSGQVQASDVASITLDDIRRGGPTFVRDKLLALSRTSTSTSISTSSSNNNSSSSSSSSYVVVNAVTRSDLECAVLGSLMAEDAGEGGARIVYRTAADWVAIRAGLPPLPPLPASAFHATPSSLPPSGPPSAKGGLVVVGSYVPKSSEQLACLLEGGQAGKMEGVEVSVDTLLESEAQRQAEVKRVTAAIEQETNKGKDVVVYTTRQLRQEDGAGGLLSGMTVSESLVQIVKDLKTRPHFLIAKGGITSNDVAVKALGIKRAMVLGPILPGVPVWECGAESKFPGMKYVVFPGNVGSPQALLDAVQKLTHHQASSSPASSSSSSSSSTPTRPLFIPSTSSRTLDLVEAARAKGQAVGAFNVYNLESVRAVVLAAAATDSSAILQVHPSSFDFGGAPLLELCRAARLYLEEGGRAGGKEGRNRIAVHLDHAHETASIERVLALDLVDSVMCDGSALPYEQNVAWTAKMTRLAHSKGVPVEAELGRLAGEEDGLSVAEKEAKMTDPAQVPDFVARTGVDLVAVTIGNVHGRYATNPPVLDLQRLADIRKVTDRPLVLHGASGLPPSLVHATMKIGGVCKFNVNTEVREAAMRVVREGKAKDVLPLMMATGEAMQVVIEEKMRLFKPTS